MELLSNVLLGVTTALQPINLMYCFFGSLIGTVIGVLPGLGPITTLALLLPMTFGVPPTSALIMLAGIYYGAQYGGSTTAILVNVPGESASAVTTLDGHQLALKGRAGPALVIAALGSFAAGTIATLVVILFSQPLAAFAATFTSAEYFSLTLMGLLCSVALSRGSVLKALGMVSIGLLMGCIRIDMYTGMPRFTFDLPELADGLDFVAVAVGVFGIAEILRNFSTSSSPEGVVRKIEAFWPSRKELLRSIGPIGRGTLIGSLLGVVPGGGAVLASFASYVIEKKLSRHPEEFGKGAIEGVAGPESANNAGAQTSFIPMLTLGIPTNPVMAVMIGALIIQGIVPGPQVATKQPELFWGVIASMWVGNFMLIILNIPLVGIWIKMLRTPYYILFPAILAFSSIGIYGVAFSQFDVLSAAAFGFGGYVLSRWGCEAAPFILGFILGPMLEEHLRRTMIVSLGDPTILVTRPVSAVFLAITALMMLALLLPSLQRKREEVFVED